MITKGLAGSQFLCRDTHWSVPIDLLFELHSYSFIQCTMAKKKYYLQTPAKENARYICKPPVHLYKHANTEFDSQHSFGKSTLQRLLFFPPHPSFFTFLWEFNKNLKESETHLTFNSCYSKWLKALTIIFFFINKNSITVKWSRLIFHELHFCHFSAETWQHFMAKKKLILSIFPKHLKRKIT